MILDTAIRTAAALRSLGAGTNGSLREEAIQAVADVRLTIDDLARVRDWLAGWQRDAVAECALERLDAAIARLGGHADAP